MPKSESASKWSARVVRHSDVVVAHSEITDVSDRNEAYSEFRGIAADLLPGLARGLAQNDEYCLELLDAEQRPLHRIRLVSETIEL